MSAIPQCCYFLLHLGDAGPLCFILFLELIGVRAHFPFPCDPLALQFSQPCAPRRLDAFREVALAIPFCLFNAQLPPLQAFPGALPTTQPLAINYRAFLRLLLFQGRLHFAVTAFQGEAAGAGFLDQHITGSSMARGFRGKPFQKPGGSSDGKIRKREVIRSHG